MRDHMSVKNDQWMSDADRRLLEASGIINDPRFDVLLKFFEEEYNRLVNELIDNTLPEVHLTIRGQVIVFNRLKDLRSHVRKLIKEM